MSVRRDEYIVKGFRLTDEQIDQIVESKGEEYLWDLEDVKDKRCWLLRDGMSGEYNFFGICLLLNEWEEENYTVTEFKFGENETELIMNKFREVFSHNHRVAEGTFMPEMKFFHVPHYH